MIDQASTRSVPVRRSRPLARTLAGLPLVALTLLAAAASPAGAVVAADAPKNASLPVIHASSTTLREADVVTATPGTWTGTPTIYYTYQWLRCAGATFATCSPIAGAKKPTYTLVAADVGRPLIVQVKASNTGGATFAISQATPTGISTVLRLALGPSIGGAPVVGSTLTADPGTWVSGDPVAFTYQWTRCAVGGSACSPIPTGKRQSYTVVTEDVGRRLFVQVKATSGTREAFANSARTGTVTAESAAGVLDVSAVSLPNRLVISGVQFQPQAITSRTPFTARYRVTDVAGKPVRGALVYALGIPFGWIAAAREVVTDEDGLASVTLVPTARLPLESERALVLFVRARKPGEPLLAGVSARRLTQIPVGTRSLSAPASARTANAVVPIGEVALPKRLVISDVKFEPRAIGSRSPFVARFRVTDTAGNPVQGALVLALGLPFGWVTEIPEAATDAQGWATFKVTPTSLLPLRKGTSLVMFVRARKAGENVLGGVSNRRLVQVAVG